MAKRYYMLLAVFVVIYTATIFVFQPDSDSLARYHIDATQLRILSLTIIIPAIGIWFAAFYSIINMTAYVQKIKDGSDGEGFKYLLWGLIVLGLSLPISSILSRLLSYAAQQGSISRATSTIISTHLTALFYLFVFFFIFRGTLILLRSVKRANLAEQHIAIVILALCVIGTPYIIATLSNPSREIAVAPATIATYYMPDWLTFTTIIVPYLVLWTFGLLATMHLHAYHRIVGGKIYRTSLSKMNQGFFVVIISTVLVQFISAATTSISGWGLGAVLTLLYVFLAFTAIGFVLIALGVKELSKLEEVT